MDWKNVFERIDDLSHEYISVWEDVCNIESPTGCKAGVDAVGRYFIDRAKAHGWKIEIHEEKVSGNCVCITMNPDAPGRPVALSGHMDTVHPIGLFGYPPVHIEGDRIYGPGVEDCKGGVVSSFLAMDALEQCGYKDRPVMLLLQSDEENSSATSEKRTIVFMAEKAKDCVAFLNAEGNRKGVLVGIRKGILRYTFEVAGVAAHSSRCYLGANAIAEAAHKILALEAWKDPDGLTCNCGMIEGGSAPNSVPATCTFVADIRYANEAQMKQAEEFVQKIAAHSYLEGTTCTVTEKSRRVAMELNGANQKLYDRICEIFSETGLPEVILGSSNGGSDAAWMTVYGIPCLDNFGVSGGKIHSKDEYADLDSLAYSAKMMASVILKL